MVRLADVQPGQGAASEIESVKRRGVAHELTVDSLPHKRDAAAFIPTVKAGFYGEIERFTCHCKAVRSRKQRGRVRAAVGRHGDGQAECDSEHGGQQKQQPFRFHGVGLLFLEFEQVETARGSIIIYDEKCIHFYAASEHFPGACRHLKAGRGMGISCPVPGAVI